MYLVDEYFDGVKGIYLENRVVVTIKWKTIQRKYSYKIGCNKGKKTGSDLNISGQWGTAH